LDLLLRHAEHSAAPDDARARPDGCLDEPVPEAEALGQLQSDAVPLGPSASGAWDGAHPDEAADAAHQPLVLLVDAGAERSVDPAQGGPALDVRFQPGHRPAQSERAAGPDAAAPYTLDAVQSEERSCVALDFAAWEIPLVPTDAERSKQLGARAVPKP
jgi:hypothetical protein